MERTLPYILFVYLILNFSLTFVWPSYRVWKRTGIFPVTFGSEDSAHDFIGRVFKILLFTLLLMGAIYAFAPSLVKFIIPVYYLDKNWARMIGISILFLALLWIIAAQRQMADSWRIGIDEKHSTDLVTSGVFALSRNPIFLGMQATISGVFLVMPNVLSFAILVAVWISVQIQVRLEESFLSARHGEAYRAYCASVRRWI